MGLMLWYRPVVSVLRLGLNLFNSFYTGCTLTHEVVVRTVKISTSPVLQEDPLSNTVSYHTLPSSRRD
jgi:hypothetical protein